MRVWSGSYSRLNHPPGSIYSRFVSATGIRGEPADTAVGPLEEGCSSLGLLLALLGQYAMRCLREAHIRHELSPRQFQLLGLVHDRGPIGQRELGQAMQTDPSILVTLLNPLEARRLLSRQRDRLDRRRHLVKLTAKGERRLAAAAEAQREAEEALFAGLGAAQREQLHILLTELRDGLPARREPDTSRRACEGR